MLGRRALPLAGSVLMVLAVTGCSPASWGTVPDITGPWTGAGRDADGTTANEAVTGSFVDGGKGLVLTERAALWQGEVTGNTKRVTVSWTGDPSHGAFQMTLTRQWSRCLGRRGSAHRALGTREESGRSLDVTGGSRPEVPATASSGAVGP
jgi:hypothetical protein